jgi:sarcosine oxidase subunit gamma
MRASPLAQWGTRLTAASVAVDHFTIQELAFRTQVNLRGDPGESAFVQAVASATGLALPLEPNTSAASELREAIWLGPDEWLITAPDGEHRSLPAALREVLNGLHHSVVDQSANRTIIEIAGSEARVVLAKGCTLDLHASTFSPPRCAQTLLAKSQVLVQCVAGDVFRLFVRNSFADYLAEWLVDAAAECAAARVLDTGRVAARLA